VKKEKTGVSRDSYMKPNPVQFDKRNTMPGGRYPCIWLRRVRKRTGNWSSDWRICIPKQRRWWITKAGTHCILRVHG